MGMGMSVSPQIWQQFEDLVFQDDLIKCKQNFDVIMDDTLESKYGVMGTIMTQWLLEGAMVVVPQDLSCDLWAWPRGSHETPRPCPQVM